MILEGQGILSVVIDVAAPASAEEKANIRELAHNDTVLPPQISNQAGVAPGEG